MVSNSTPTVAPSLNPKRNTRLFGAHASGPPQAVSYQRGTPAGLPHCAWSMVNPLDVLACVVIPRWTRIKCSPGAIRVAELMRQLPSIAALIALDCIQQLCLYSGAVAEPQEEDTTAESVEGSGGGGGGDLYKFEGRSLSIMSVSALDPLPSRRHPSDCISQNVHPHDFRYKYGMLNPKSKNPTVAPSLIPKRKT